MPDSPDTQRELPAEPSRRIAGPLLFSVMLHGGMLVLLARAVIHPATESGVPDARPSVRVLVELVSPRSLVQEPPTEPRRSQEPEEREDPPASGDQSETSAAETTPGADEGNDAPEAAATTWTQAAISTAIRANTSERRSLLTESWVDHCILEQKERGIRNCERQREEQDYRSASGAAGYAAGGAAFAAVTRPQRHALLSEGFVKEQALMRELMAAAGPAGELAKARFFLSRGYFLYLNGNPSPYGPRNQFNCAGLGPCIYEYTGFVIERPQPQPEENAFQVVPIVLGSQR